MHHFRLKYLHAIEVVGFMADVRKVKCSMEPLGGGIFCVAFPKGYHADAAKRKFSFLAQVPVCEN